MEFTGIVYARILGWSTDGLGQATVSEIFLFKTINTNVYKNNFRTNGRI